MKSKYILKLYCEDKLNIPIYGESARPNLSSFKSLQLQQTGQTFSWNPKIMLRRKIKELQETDGGGS